MNSTRPQLAIVLDSIRSSFIDAKGRGIKLRYLTGITYENITYCKELMSIVDELRHLEGIKGNFMLSESEYLAPLVLIERGKAAARIVHSNVKELVEQHEYMFDTLWSKAISAEDRIREIEQGTNPIRTRLLENPNDVSEELKKIINTSEDDSWSICSTFDGLLMLTYNKGFERMQRRLLDSTRRGKDTRWVGSINKDNMHLVKTYIDLGMKIKQIKNIPPMNFAISSKELYATIDEMKGGQIARNLLVSNEPNYVKHFKSIFEELWENGIDAAERIKEIEEKVEVEFVDVIADPEKTSSILVDLAKSIRNEALCMVPTVKGLIRIQKLGVFDHIIKASQNGATAKIICPVTEDNAHIVEDISKQAPAIRIMNMCTDAPSGVVIVDSCKYLQYEIKDPMAEEFSGAVGFGVYSNSKYNVKSAKVFFELLWNQHALNEQLKVHDRMQQDFINIAAHELRTPIEPVLLGSEQLKHILPNDEIVSIVHRNAKKLQTLSNTILDAARIESNTFQLYKDRVNIKNIILDALELTIGDYSSSLLSSLPSSSSSYTSSFTCCSNKQNGLRILYEPHDIFIEADKDRIIQVVSNLLNNAVKSFGERERQESERIISIIIQMREGEQNDSNEVLISISDNGNGIDPEVMPRLFTRFASKSFEGTGLGLYISKNIVEAHGGKIWAENNSDGKGAMFSFSLPLLMSS
jgi:signal transduction histidine kinase